VTAIRWRPSPAEERWLEVATALGQDVSEAAVAERTGGWRSTGPYARMALFVLGLVAAALLFGLLGFNDTDTLVLAGVIAALAAEWLIVGKRLHASGIEEGLCVAGYLLVAAWLLARLHAQPAFGGSGVDMLVLAAALAAAGLRLLNPLLTTCAALAVVDWVGSIAPAHAVDQVLGRGWSAFSFGCALALVALAVGARTFRRPSHDRMLDWLVAILPIASHAHGAPWGAFEFGPSPHGVGIGRLATTALLLVTGAALLVTGLRRRRHAPLIGFIGCIVCLAVELRFAAALTTEAWLLACGFAALVAGVTLERYLRRPRDGLTSAALTQREGPLDLLQTAGAVLLAQRAAPDSSPTPPEPETTTGGGGRFGGGGATGTF
jgi:hypothetical protein